MIHRLKSWPEPFEEIRLGVKRTEIRSDGPAKGHARFNGGDVLILKEWDPTEARYTGRQLSVLVRRLTRLWEAPSEWDFQGASVVVMEIEVLGVAGGASTADKS